MKELTKETSISKKETSKRKKAADYLVDCDIHNDLKSFDDLKPYMPRTWWSRLDDINATIPLVNYHRAVPLLRRDAIPGDGLKPGSDPEYAKCDLLDRYNIDIGILTGGLFEISAHYNPDYAAELASAYNDYIFDTWVAHDERWRASIVISTRDPIKAAEEIKRLGDHPKVVQVLMAGGSRELYGQRQYYPIYEAAAMHNLPIAIHPGGEGAGINPPVSATGNPTTMYERYNILPIHAMSHLNSLVCEGVFEKFPELKVIFVEYGLAWVPALLWRLDKAYKAYRRQVPWLKSKPSEYITKHFRFTTQPIDEPVNKQHLLQLLDMIQAEKTVMFATDYPHWDNDEPTFVLRNLPDQLKKRIAGETAKELYQL